MVVFKLISYSENFAFLILRILELITRKVCLQTYRNIRIRLNMLRKKILFKKNTNFTGE